MACGTWPASLSAVDAAAAGLRLSQVRLAHGRVHWLEGRPAEGGRQVVCREAAPAQPEELVPAGRSARARVHEYGGGDYALGAGGLFFVADGAAGGIQRVREGRCEPVPGTAPDALYADLAVSPDGRWLVAVEERPAEPEPRNRLLALPLAGGHPVAFASSHDFVSSPCFSPDGSRLAYLSWEHPDMPWDATVLRELPFAAEGPAGASRAVVGGPGESVCQPGYSPGGRLTFVSDRDGFWNLHQERDGALRNLHRCEFEFGLPQWVLGQSTWAFLGEDRIACVVRADGVARVAGLDLVSGRLEDWDLPLSEVTSLAADAERVALVAAAPDRPESIRTLRLADGRLETLRAPQGATPSPEGISRAQSFWFPTGDDERAHAFYYAPCNPKAHPPPGERPPLLVKIHGGPTAAASSGLDPGVQYWTQRGFGVVDVNHRGSTGFGRSFRQRLYGGWGLVEVADCIAAARALAERGEVDGERLAIRGGSAGGFSALSALAFHDVFATGCSRYGVADLEALLADTHKFESRYLQRLVAPWPEGREIYRARSPLHHVEGIRVPVLFFQGLDDRVVPPSQTEALVEALAARGTPHAYVAFPGEGHGFRRAENLATSLEAEHWFYGRIFGFETGAPPPGVALRAGNAGGL